MVQPSHGPTLFAGLSKRVDLKLVSRLEFGSGAVAMRYEPRREPSGLLGPSRPHHGATQARPSKFSTNLTIGSASR